MYHVYSSFDDPTMDRSSEAVPRYLISNATLIFSLRNRRSLATRTTTFRCPQRRLTVRQRVRTATFIPRIAKIDAGGVLIGLFPVIYDRPMIDFGWRVPTVARVIRHFS